MIVEDKVRRFVAASREERRSRDAAAANEVVEFCRKMPRVNASSAVLAAAENLTLFAFLPAELVGLRDADSVLEEIIDVVALAAVVALVAIAIAVARDVDY